MGFTCLPCEYQKRLQDRHSVTASYPDAGSDAMPRVHEGAAPFPQYEYGDLVEEMPGSPSQENTWIAECQGFMESTARTPDERYSSKVWPLLSLCAWMCSLRVCCVCFICSLLCQFTGSHFHLGSEFKLRKTNSVILDPDPFRELRADAP